MDQIFNPEMLGEYAAYLFPIALIAVILLSFLARYGYTVFKKCLSICGAIAFGSIGSIVVAPLLMNMISLEINFISIPTVIGAILAIIGAVLIIYVYKLAIFVVGGALGYFIAQMFVAPLLPAEVAEGVAGIVISAVVALVVAILAVILFKPLFIIITSIFGMIGAALIAAYVILPELTMIPLVVFAVIGFILGIVFAKKQFADHKGKA